MNTQIKEDEQQEKVKTFPKKMYLGTVSGEDIYLSCPSWACGWYWGFAYIGNENCHYHLSGLKDKHKTHLHDAIQKEFECLQILPSMLWKFAEIVETAYKFKDIAEVYNIGGSLLTDNPCESFIKNEEEYIRINTVVLPRLFKEMYRILEHSNKMIEKGIPEIVEIYNLLGTENAVKKMFSNITPDDLRTKKDGVYIYVDGLDEKGFSRIYTEYTRQLHKNKPK